MLLVTAAVHQLHTYVELVLVERDALLIKSRTNLSPSHSRARRSSFHGMPLVQVNIFLFSFGTKLIDVAPAVGPNNSYITSTSAGTPAWVGWSQQLNLTYELIHPLILNS